MLFYLFIKFLFSQTKHQFSSVRRSSPISIDRNAVLQKRSSANQWYFVHFDQISNHKDLQAQGIILLSENMINQKWFSLYLTPKQANYLSNFAAIRPIENNEKILNAKQIKYSQFLQIETSKDFDVSSDLSMNVNEITIDQISSSVYRIKCPNTVKSAIELAQNHKIYAISPINSSVFMNNRISGFTQSNTRTCHLSGPSNNIIEIDRPLNLNGLDGNGTAVLVDDTFLDYNSTFFYDPEISEFQLNHLYDNHRKIKILFDPNMNSHMNENAHGTHVAGTSLGKSHLSSETSDMPLYNGIAPESKLVFYQGGASGAYLAHHLEYLITNTNATVCTNSWGDRQHIGLQDTTWNINALNYTKTLFLFAAGNFGTLMNDKMDYYQTVLSPASAKNVLTVGALAPIPVDEVDSDGSVVLNESIKSVYLSYYESTSLNKIELLSWSNTNYDNNPGLNHLFKYGTLDATIKNTDVGSQSTILLVNTKEELRNLASSTPPFIVFTTTRFDSEDLHFDHDFPVFYIDSDIAEHLRIGMDVTLTTNYVVNKHLDRASFSSKGPTTMGIIKPEIMTPGSSVFSAKSIPNGEPGHEGIYILDGTSMATPNAAGAAALITQYFQEGYYRKSLNFTPSSTLIRSLMINAADPIDKSKVYPNPDTGFGILNLNQYIVLNDLDDINHVLIGQDIPIHNGDHLYSEININGNDKDLRITISNLDSATNPDSNIALILDLDLVVISPNGKVYRGNQRVDDTEEKYSTNERVLIDKSEVVVGKYQIHVFAFIPEIVNDRTVDFSITIFGSLSETSDSISFDHATECIPVQQNCGKCDTETTRNVCDQYHTGHSCQNPIISMLSDDDFGREVYEIEPLGIAYLNILCPYDAEFDTMEYRMTTSTYLTPKYSYIKNFTNHSLPFYEYYADGIELTKDLSVTVRNEGQVPAWENFTCLFAMIYNKSPTKTKCVVSYDKHIEQPWPPIDPTSIPTSNPTSELTSNPTSIPSSDSFIPTETSDETSHSPPDENNDRNSGMVSQSSFITAIVLAILFALSTISLLVYIILQKRQSTNNGFKSETGAISLTDSLIE